MAEKPAGHILIECPNTIFHLYARDEGELSKIETFLRNIMFLRKSGITRSRGERSALTFGVNIAQRFFFVTRSPS